MSAHPIRRLTTAVLAVAIWAVLVAGAASARTGPEDDGSSAVFITQPAVVVTEPVSWTHYALVAAIACLVGFAATLAIQAVVRRSHHAAIASA